jgi:hypothetical protein
MGNHSPSSIVEPSPFRLTGKARDLGFTHRYAAISALGRLEVRLEVVAQGESARATIGAHTQDLVDL